TCYGAKQHDLAVCSDQLRERRRIAVERTSVFFICAINFARRNFAEPLKFTWDQSSGRSDHVSGPYIARDLGKFLCIGQFPAKIKSANEAEYLAQRHALIAQAPGHARLHTITHDLGAPSSANAFGISLEPSTSASAWAQSQVRIHPPCRAVHSFRKPCDGLRLPPQRVLQGIVWLFDPYRVSLELLSSVLSRFTNELFSWKKAEHLLKSLGGRSG